MDDTAAAGPSHGGYDSAAHQKGAADIGRKGFVPHRKGEFDNRAARLVSRHTVHQNVDMAEHRHRSGYGRLNVILASEIAAANAHSVFHVIECHRECIGLEVKSKHASSRRS